MAGNIRAELTTSQAGNFNQHFRWPKATLPEYPLFGGYTERRFTADNWSPHPRSRVLFVAR